MIAIQPRFLALLALCAAAVAVPSGENFSRASNVSEPVHVPRAGVPAGLPAGLPTGLPLPRAAPAPSKLPVPAPAIPTPHGMVRKRSSPSISAKLPTGSDISTDKLSGGKRDENPITDLPAKLGSLPVGKRDDTPTSKLPLSSLPISKAPVHPRSEYVPQPVGHPPISRPYARQVGVVDGFLDPSGRKDMTITNPMASPNDDRNIIHTNEDSGTNDMTVAPAGEDLAHTYTKSRRGGEMEGSEDMDSDDYDEREQTEERRAEVEKHVSTPSNFPVGSAAAEGEVQRRQSDPEEEQYDTHAESYEDAQQ